MQSSQILSLTVVLTFSVPAAALDIGAVVGVGAWEKSQTAQLESPSSTANVFVQDNGVGVSKGGRGGKDGQAFTATSFASATVSPGVLKFAGHSESQGAVNASAHSSLYYTDSFTIDAGKSGQQLVISYSIVVRGSLDGSFATEAGGSGTQVHSSFGLNHRFQGDDNSWHFIAASKRFDVSGNVVSDSTVDGAPVDAFSTFNFTARVLSGQTTSFEFDATGETLIQPETIVNGTARASYDLSQSIYWGGISSVTAVNGEALAYQLNSASGINYANSFVPPPVPEPSTWALMASGLFLLRTLRKVGRRPSCIAKAPVL